MKRVVLKRMMAMGIATVLTVSCTFTDYPGVFSPQVVYAAEDSVVWEAFDSAVTNQVTFSEGEDWNNVAQVSFAGNGTTIEAGSKATFTLTITKEGFESLKDGYLKLEGDLFQEESNWDTLVKAGWPQLYQSDFTQNEDGSYSTDYSLTFDQGGTLALLMIRTVGTNFSGSITYSNVKITKEQEPVLTYQEPTVLGLFDAGIDGWEPEAGYDYSNGDKDSVERAEKADVSYNAEGQQLKMHLDYSANATSGWSEAKVTGRFSDGIDVSNYNLVTFEISYPKQFSFASKIFAAGGEDGSVEIINKQAELVASSLQSLDDEYNKAIIKVSFKPNDAKMTSLTIGIVGQNTDFVGDIYIDNVTVKQADATEDYVPITSVVKDTVDTANISNMTDVVKLVDPEATSQTKVLASYLKSLMESDQVLFGHQNATFRSVQDNGETSDVKDMVGSLPAIVGIDSLALSGCETSASNQEEALQKSVEASKKGYEEGAIVTLSAHMPNFTNNKIVKNEDGTYDFTACDFTESKDCTNNCADQILQGGAYNDVYNAYLDMIADYALALQEDSIPVLFRPFHENNGSWFWWGSTTSVESYKAIYRYMVDYLEGKGVHNLLYIYSPNGPFSSEEEYLERYPGDEYIDIVAFDYYDDYNSYPAEYNDKFFENLEQSCNVVASIAESHGKIPAISETGCRVTRSNGDFNGLAITENPIAGQDWYTKVMEVAKETGMPYYMVWANFDDSNFFVPYKYNDTLGQELINDFIDFYNNESSIFANGTNFYNEEGAVSKQVTETSYSTASGYLVTPKDYAVIFEPTKVKASVKNANKVEFVVKASENSEEITLAATKNAEGLYEAQIDAATLEKLGKTDVGIITVMADGQKITYTQFVSFNKEKDVAPAYSIDDFEFYNGNDALLSSTYGSPNSAANCTSSFTLDTVNKAGGSYSGAFNYTLTYNGSEVWTGLGKALSATDYSEYNAFSMWVNPDGNGQKLVIQFVSNGEEFEAYLSDFVKGTKAQYVTIPFSSFKGKASGTFDASNITKFAVWCNSIPDNYTGEKDADGYYKVSGTITFDDIKTVKISEEALGTVNTDGLIITDEPLEDLSKDETVSVAGVTLDKTEATLTAGDTMTLVANVLPEDASDKEVTWSSSDAKIVTVKDGVVTALSKGTATITVTTKDGSYTAHCKVSVKDKIIGVTGVKLNATKKTLNVGATTKLTATVLPVNASNKQVAYSTSNKSVATVSSDGTVKGIKAGTSVITVTTKDGGYKASCTVTVKAVKVTKIKLSNSKIRLAIGAKKTLKVAVILPSNATNKGVTWISSNTKVAKVSSTGKVTAVSIGTATIKAVAKDGSKVSASCVVNVSPVKVTKVKATKVSKTGVTLSWRKQSNVTGYRIYRYNTKTKSYQYIKAVKSNSATISGLNKNTTYKFKIAAYKKVGSQLYKGTQSEIRTIKTKK